MLHTRTGLITLVGIGFCASALAQDEAAFNVDLAECVGLDTEAARFACYEERVEAARTGSSAPAASDSAQRATAPATADSASATAESAPAGNVAARRAPVRPEEQEVDEIFSTITALREMLPNQWVITLDNGQVWQMNNAKRYPLRVGLDVRLYSTNWGPSYRLTALEHGGFVVVQQAL
ncbi:MAG TPA: hypothetical protein VKQ06_03675 [Gammaproteobacteria bacterium]|nr:hypothetical protein [Gammaproteobacteria bacterium]